MHDPVTNFAVLRKVTDAQGCQPFTKVKLHTPLGELQAVRNAAGQAVLSDAPLDKLPRAADAHVMSLAGSAIVYHKAACVGTGGFGDCFLGVHTRLGPVALKRMRLTSYGKRNGKIKAAATELHALKREYVLSERFGGAAAPLLGVRIGTKAYIVSPLLTGDALEWDSFLKSRDVPTESIVRHFLTSVVPTLMQMHGEGFLHNDVKLTNTFVGGGDGTLLALSDFGLSFQLAAGNVGGNITLGAPEHLLEDAPCLKSDTYSLGLACLKLVLGRNCFDTCLDEDCQPTDGMSRADMYAAFEQARCAVRQGAATHGLRDDFVDTWQAARETFSPGLFALVSDLCARQPPDRPADAAILMRLQGLASDAGAALLRTACAAYRNPVLEKLTTLTLAQEAVLAGRGVIPAPSHGVSAKEW